MEIGPVLITTDTQGQIKVLPPKTAEEILSRERERKARTTLLMALPEDHLTKFHKMADAKEMWEAIKSRFGGNDESKKMQKYIIKQQFEGFSVSNSEGLHKGYDSTNDVSIAYGVSNPSGQNSQYENASSYSLLANQSSCPQLDHEDLEQIDEFDLEEMDLKWQVAMISMRMKKFYKKTRRKLQFDAKEPVGFDKTKVECYNCHKTGHFARECRTKGNQDSRRRDAWNSRNKDKENGRRSGKQEDSKALVTIDGEGVDWTSHSEEEEDYALMACNSSGSDTEVQSCSNECVASYNKLKKLYDEQRAQLSDASIEIKAYTQALKKVEAQLVAHQQGQLWYEEKIRFMKIDLDDKTDVLTYHKKLLAEAEKEKEDLKAKVEKWHNSSKNLSLLQNSQMSANDKFGLGTKGILVVDVQAHDWKQSPTLLNIKTLMVDPGISDESSKKNLMNFIIYGKIPIISYIRPFGCHVTILNTIDHLGKFDGKSDEGFLVGEKTNAVDLVFLTDSMKLSTVRSEESANKHAGPQESNSKGYEAELLWTTLYCNMVFALLHQSRAQKLNKQGEDPIKIPGLKPIDKEIHVFLEELKRLKRQEHDANDAAEALRKEFAKIIRIAS
ncbi:ribonuclease H-like domain-containing protein [Tanacetum coccineum]